MAQVDRATALLGSVGFSSIDRVPGTYQINPMWCTEGAPMT